MTGRRLFVLFIVFALALGTVPAFAEETQVAVQAAVVGVVREQAVVTEETNGDTGEVNVKISKDVAKQSAKKFLKEYFNLEIDEKKFQTGLEQRQDYEKQGSYIWEINWNLNDNEKGMNIQVSVDCSTGKVINVYRHEYYYRDGNQPAVATMTEEEAGEIAGGFIQKLHPEEYKETKIKENMQYYYGGYNSANYSFTYQRYINGIEFERNYITVEVDGTNGMIRSYRYRWDDGLEVPDPSKAIDVQKAEEIFKGEVDMNLSFIPLRNDPYDYSDNIQEIKLVYAAEYANGTMVDAENGKMINFLGDASQQKIIKDITDKQKEELFNNAPSISPSNKEIDESEAKKIILSKSKEILGDGYEVESLRYLEGAVDYWESSGKKAWSAQLRKSSGQGRYDFGANITIDALTGELISYYHHMWGMYEEEEFEPAITWEGAYDKAVELMGKYYPHKIKDVKTEQTYVKYPRTVNGKEMPESYYYFSFPRVVDGIVYQQDQISIGFNVKTGEVTEMRCMWNESVKFPAKEGSITPEEAERIYFEVFKPQLVYTMINPSNDYRNPVWETKLVYRLSPSEYNVPIMYVDGFTGKLLNYSGEEIKKDMKSFKEATKGHWAEKELNILLNQGIVDEKDFDADRTVTRMEAIKMMVRAKGYYPYQVQQAEPLKFGSYPKEDTNYKYLQLAVQYGILENKEMEFIPDETITREEMAEMLINLLQYKKIASIKDIYKLSFSDANSVSPDKVGAVALCKGLGIINGGGSFRPQDEATMAEMAVAIFNALGNMR